VVKEAIEGEEGSVIESTASDINASGSADTISTTVEKAIDQGKQEPVNHTQSTYSHDESVASKTAHEEDWLPMKEASVKKTSPLYTKPRGTTELPPEKEFNENMPDIDTGVKKTTAFYTKPKGTSDIPDDMGQRPRTIGTARDSPMFKEQKKESLFTKISESPRRVKERAEEMGYSAQKAYHSAREVPAETAAKERYESRMAENDIKFEKGEISSTIHKRRQMEYATEFDKEKKPIEQRVVATSMHVGNAFISGLQHTQQKVAKEYRSSPAPRIKPSRGVDTSRIENIGVRPAASKTTRKGKQPVAAPRYQIDFGKSGGSPIDFSGGYNIFGAKKKKR